MKYEAKKIHSLDLIVSQELKAPSLYQVVMLNDDFTPMEFVVELLEKYFFMERQQAIRTMFEIHAQGAAVCGIYSRDYAEAKVAQVINVARGQAYPLICSMEAA